MGKTHTRLVNKLVRQLKQSKEYDFVTKNQIYPLEPHKEDIGEVDVLAGNYHTGLLDTYEVKSSPNYLWKGREQLKKSKKYYSRFKYKKNRFFLLYKDYNGLETKLQIIPNGEGNRSRRK